MWTMNRKPTSPGEILREEFLKPLGITQAALAIHIGCDVKVINRIVNERAGITAEVALKLGAAFATSADFWLNAQQALDLYRASKSVKRMPKSLLKSRGRSTPAA
jgi:addiction module HigA family antidote